MTPSEAIRHLQWCRALDAYVRRSSLSVNNLCVQWKKLTKEKQVETKERGNKSTRGGEKTGLETWPVYPVRSLLAAHIEGWSLSLSIHVRLPAIA